MPKKETLPKKQRDAARLIAEDLMTMEQIVEKLDMSRSQLNRWKKLDAFKAAVARMTDQFHDRAMNHGLAKKEKRLYELDDLYARLRTVITERSAHPDYQHIPGGKTGIVTRMLKGIGRGEDFQVVEVYEVDTGALKEMRAIHQQYAEELGQRIEKFDVTVKDKKEVDGAIAELIGLGAMRDNKEYTQ